MNACTLCSTWLLIYMTQGGFEKANICTNQASVVTLAINNVLPTLLADTSYSH